MALFVFFSPLPALFTFDRETSIFCFLKEGLSLLRFTFSSFLIQEIIQLRVKILKFNLILQSLTNNCESKSLLRMDVSLRLYLAIVVAVFLFVKRVVLNDYVMVSWQQYPSEVLFQDNSVRLLVFLYLLERLLLIIFMQLIYGDQNKYNQDIARSNLKYTKSNILCKYYKQSEPFQGSSFVGFNFIIAKDLN